MAIDVDKLSPEGDGAPEMMEIEVDGKTLSLPQAAFNDGASCLNLSRNPMEPYVGTMWYRDSIQAFFRS
jgi:hypothetical protein